MSNISSESHARLSSMAVIEISGKDALSFLNRQVSNDLTKLAEPSLALSANQALHDTLTCDWQVNSLCNLKGRVIATFFAVKFADGFYLLCHKDMASELTHLLMSFKFRAKVTIVETAKVVTLLPVADVKQSEAVVIDLQDKQHALCIEDEIAQSETPASNTIWQRYLFNKNIALISKATTELFVAQHISLDAIDAISFSKGCFPGQEVIARLHYKGASKKALHLLAIDSEDVAALSGVAPGETFQYQDKRYVLVDSITENANGNIGLTMQAVG